MPASTQTAKPHSDIVRYVPILAWLPHYDRAWLSMDVLAGLTLWGLVVPEAMAYAGIAGLPPQAGSLHPAGGAARVHAAGHITLPGRADNFGDRCVASARLRAGEM